MALISVSIDQFWWFLWLKSSIHTCWFVLWWPEPLAWPFRWVKLAWKRVSSWLLYAPYTTVGHRPGDPLNVNQIGFFLAFSSKVSQIEPENASGAMKSQKAAIWITLLGHLGLLGLCKKEIRFQILEYYFHFTKTQMTHNLIIK